MNKEILMGALAGAVVTVAVYEGTAMIFPAEGNETSAAVEIAAGQTHTLGLSKGAPGGVKIQLGAPPEGETPAQAVVRLTEERDALVQALSASKFEGAMVKGQLAAHQGDPIPWDDKIPKRFHPEAVEAGVHDFLADRDDITLASLDCTEFPCIATFHPTVVGEDSIAAARALPDEYAAAMFGEDAQVMGSVSQSESDGVDPITTVSVSAVPSESGEDLDWQTRTQYRTQAIIEGLIEDMEGQNGEDVDLHE